MKGFLMRLAKWFGFKHPAHDAREEKMTEIHQQREETERFNLDFRRDVDEMVRQLEAQTRLRTGRRRRDAH
jgi:hypothetical protein